MIYEVVMKEPQKEIYITRHSDSDKPMAWGRMTPDDASVFRLGCLALRSTTMEEIRMSLYVIEGRGLDGFLKWMEPKIFKRQERLQAEVAE